MVHKEDLLEMFITYDLEDLYGDFSDDGDGKLELTEKGNEVATRLIKLVEQELDRAREEGRREQQKLDCELYGTAVATDKEVEEMWKTKLERMRDKAEKELDKLSNK